MTAIWWLSPGRCKTRIPYKDIFNMRKVSSPWSLMLLKSWHLRSTNVHKHHRVALPKPVKSHQLSIERKCFDLFIIIQPWTWVSHLMSEVCLLCPAPHYSKGDESICCSCLYLYWFNHLNACPCCLETLSTNLTTNIQDCCTQIYS